MVSKKKQIKCKANCYNVDEDDDYCGVMQNEADDEADCKECTFFESKWE